MRRVSLLKHAAEAFLLCGNISEHIKVNLKLVLYYLHFDKHHPDMLALINQSLDLARVMIDQKKINQFILLCYL